MSMHDENLPRVNAAAIAPIAATTTITETAETIMAPLPHPSAAGATSAVFAVILTSARKVAITAIIASSSTSSSITETAETIISAPTHPSAAGATRAGFAVITTSVRKVAIAATIVSSSTTTIELVAATPIISFTACTIAVAAATNPDTKTLAIAPFASVYADITA